ncbi:MAG: glycosyltransferase, partial [Clostridiales bacterium]|nr:glycosyltransferase [Clostridiales bacterium]
LRRNNAVFMRLVAFRKRLVYDIAKGEGFSEEKMEVSYIGTLVAEKQIGHSNAQAEDGLKVVFLGSDLNYEEKGYPWLLDTLEQLDQEHAKKVDLILTTRTPEHAEIYTMCKHFRSVKVIPGYTHKDLEWILDGCNLGIVPVLWEDNLPQIAIEMVAYGVPVLASKAGGATELCDCDLFKFEAGNSEEFLDKLVHFIDTPGDLEQYWEHHSGLVTMKDHLTELIRFYGLPEETSMISITQNDLSYLLQEHEFLKNNIPLNDEDIVPRSIFDSLQEKLNVAEKRIHMLENELEEAEDMKQFEGKVTFQTRNDTTPEFREKSGATLFKLTLDDFNYSDFYAEIRFIKIMNKEKSYSDTLHISGTWHNESGEYKLYIHNMEFEKMEPEIVQYIFGYIRENEIFFFGKYPTQFSAYSWKLLSVTSRALHNTITPENINIGNITKNELMPEDCFAAKMEN